MGQDKLRREKGENGFSPKGPGSTRLSWKAMPSFSSSSMIQLSSSEVLEAGGGREGRGSPTIRSGRGSMAGRGLDGCTLLPKSQPPHSLSRPRGSRPRLTEVPKLGIELVSQRPKD